MKYGACTSPSDGNASRITYVIGADGRVLRAHPKVSPHAHPKEILDSL